MRLSIRNSFRTLQGELNSLKVQMQNADRNYDSGLFSKLNDRLMRVMKLIKAKENKFLEKPATYMRGEFLHLSITGFSKQQILDEAGVDTGMELLADADESNCALDNLPLIYQGRGIRRMNFKSASEALNMAKLIHTRELVVL